MDSVTVRVRAAEFSATMIEISEWLDDNHYQPIGTDTTITKMRSS
jgi:hypothetical protein